MEKRIELTKGKFVLVDEGDFNDLNKYKWFAKWNGRTFYAERYMNEKETGSIGRYILMHRQILGVKEGEFVDHINGDTLDNRRGNIRICTKAQNGWNRGKQRGKYSSRYRGVCFSTEKKRWIVNIEVNGDKKYLGSFLSEDDAAKRRKECEIIYYGDFSPYGI